MVFRNDYGSIEEKRLDGTNLGLAYSEDGIKWKVEPQSCFELHDNDIIRVYDPRLTVIDNQCYVCVAADTVVSLATADVEDLINLCLNKEGKS